MVLHPCSIQELKSPILNPKQTFCVGTLKFYVTSYPTPKSAHLVSKLVEGLSSSHQLCVYTIYKKKVVQVTSAYSDSIAYLSSYCLSRSQLSSLSALTYKPIASFPVNFSIKIISMSITSYIPKGSLLFIENSIQFRCHIYFCKSMFSVNAALIKT